MVQDIKNILVKPKPPAITVKITVCRKCSYYELCHNIGKPWNDPTTYSAPDASAASKTPVLWARRERQRLPGRHRRRRRTHRRSHRVRGRARRQRSCAQARHPHRRRRFHLLFRESTFNSKLVHLLAQQHITAHFFNYYGFYSSSLVPREYLISGQVIVDQVRHYTDTAKRLAIAREFVTAAAENILNNLRYYQNRGRELKNGIDNIQHEMGMVKNAPTITDLMTAEARIRAIYSNAGTTSLKPTLPLNAAPANPGKRAQRPHLLWQLHALYHRAQRNLSHPASPGHQLFARARRAPLFPQPRPRRGVQTLYRGPAHFKLLNQGSLKKKHFDESSTIVILKKRAASFLCRPTTSGSKPPSNTVRWDAMYRTAGSSDSKPTGSSNMWPASNPIKHSGCGGDHVHPAVYDIEKNGWPKPWKFAADTFTGCRTVYSRASWPMENSRNCKKSSRDHEKRQGVVLIYKFNSEKALRKRLWGEKAPTDAFIWVVALAGTCHYRNRTTKWRKKRRPKPLFFLGILGVVLNRNQCGIEIYVGEDFVNRARCLNRTNVELKYGFHPFINFNLTVWIEPMWNWN